MDADSRLRAALATAVARGERGVQFAAFVHGELALRGSIGDADDSGTQVDDDTLFHIFSVTKGLVVTAVHLQVERGLIDLDAPVARYWPEYAAHGKHEIRVRDVLVHQSGVPQMPPGTTPERLADWEWCVTGLADLEPLFPVGTSAYASISYGWQLGEVVRRTDPKGRTFRDFVIEEIFSPLKVVDYFLGMNGQHHDRVAQLYTAGNLRPQPSAYRELAMPPSITPGPLWNSPTFYDAVVPGAGGIATATGVARFFSLLANRGELDGVRMIAADRIARFSQPRPDSQAYDEVLGQQPWIGVGGYWLGGPTPPAEPIVGTNPHILCSNGSGGSIAWADPDSGLAVAICHNRMFRINPPLPPEEHPFTELGELARSLVA